MSRIDEPLSDELVEGAVGMVPVFGPLMAPLASRVTRSFRDEYRRNTSTALSAAERRAGMSREELAEAIADDPRLIPLVTRLLYAAGMTWPG